MAAPHKPSFHALPVYPAPFRRVLLTWLPLVQALVLVLGVQGAEARRGWCRVDPVVEIGGQTAHIWVASTVEMREAASGRVRVVVKVPAGVPAREVPEASGGGFGHGIKVTFKETMRLQAAEAGVPVRISVYAPAHDDSLPVRVTFMPVADGPLSPGTATGSADDWVVLRTGP